MTEASLKLQRILAAAAIIGFVVPITSYMEWWLVIQIQKPGWGLRLTGVFDGFFVDNVLPIGAINVPLYMALGTVWCSVARARHKQP
jgi:hypothetical protein